jgi:hypothetical protein
VALGCAVGLLVLTERLLPSVLEAEDVAVTLTEIVAVPDTDAPLIVGNRNVSETVCSEENDLLWEISTVNDGDERGRECVADGLDCDRVNDMA